MTDVLAPVTICTVVGRRVATQRVQQVDGTTVLQVVPLQGTITFTPDAPEVLVATAQPDPAKMNITPYVATLDSDGYISMDGVRGAIISPTDDPSLNPTGWTYHVEEELTLDGLPVSFDDWYMDAPSGTTQDITIVSPVPSSAGNAVVVGARGAAGTVDTYPMTSAMWSQSHDKGRLVGVQCLDENGIEIDGDVVVTTTLVTVQWPVPTQGYLLLI